MRKLEPDHARNEKLNVRRATRDDLTAIELIETASFGRDAWELDWFLDYLSERKNCLFLVALTGETIAGYAIVVHKETRSELDSIAVSPSQRGGGIAAALLNRLSVLLRRRGVSTMSLMVRLDNTTAIELYRKLGFRRKRRINGYYEDGEPAWRMRASL
jgi:ribosomal-protein-alanine N-acetyltransferase